MNTILGKIRGRRDSYRFEHLRGIGLGDLDNSSDTNDLDRYVHTEE